MRAVLCAAALGLAGCSALLGLEDPVPRAVDGGGEVDSAKDAASDAANDADIDAGINVDQLVFSVASVSLAQHQTARLHIRHMHDGTTDDVTDRVTLVSGNAAIASVGGPGEINGAAQAGSTTVMARLSGVADATLQVTVKATECHPVINEFATAGVNAADEWVELYNPCTTTINIDGWTLDYRAASAGSGADSQLMIQLAGQMLPQQILFYTGVGYTGTDTPDGQWDTSASGILQQQVGAIGLRAGPTSVGDIIDAVAYGAITSPTFPFLENHPVTAMTAGVSASRLPYDGKDDDDGSADFVVSSTARTPHALNAP